MRYGLTAARQWVVPCPSSLRARDEMAWMLLLMSSRMVGFSEASGCCRPHLGETTMARVMKSTDSSSLAEVVDRILDKGIVIDAWVKVSLVGIELITIEARVVVASVETYLKYAEAVGLTASAAAPA